MVDGTPDDGTEGPIPLRARLSVSIPAEAGCPFEGGSIEGATQHTVAGGDGDDSCHVEVSYAEGSGTDRPTYLSTEVVSSCVCPVFTRFECVPRIERVSAESISFSVTVPDRTVLPDVIEALRETGATVSLDRLVQHDGSEDAMGLQTVSVTEKQREAVETAVDLGYYRTPREVGLDDLAETLGVSKSAVSQRLNAVESKLVRAMMNGG